MIWYDEFFLRLAEYEILLCETGGADQSAIPCQGTGPVDKTFHHQTAYHEINPAANRAQSPRHVEEPPIQLVPSRKWKLMKTQ